MARSCQLLVKPKNNLKEAGVEYKAGSFPMRALGRSRASMDLDGFVKILADKKTDEILGVHMIGARAADMIAEAVVLWNLELLLKIFQNVTCTSNIYRSY